MSNSLTQARQGFFTGDRATTQKVSDSALYTVDVGGNGDCGFRAVAAGLLDHVFSSPRTNDIVLKKLLNDYFRYFPQHKPEGAYLTPKDRLDMVSRNLHMPELVSTMAYALRQMAVDAMVKNPSQYRGAFVQKNENTSPEQMRKQTTWIDENALAALANELNITISVSVIEAQRELPMRLEYNKMEATPDRVNVAVVLEGKHYVPKVKNPARFQPVNQRKAREIEPAAVESPNPAMAVILDKIERDDALMLETFYATKKSIQSAVDAGELSKDELLDFYIAGMGSSDYLQGRVKQVGLEHGSQDFFQSLKARENSQPEQRQANTHDERIIQELVHALARAVSIGQLSEDKLFTSVEEHRNAFK